jgi:uncharacterized protein YprB with RNaseH-like and TPR domain
MPNDIKLLVLDIETTDLNADRGHILCAGAKWVGKPKIYKWRIDDTPGYGDTPRSFFNDSSIVDGLKELAQESDAIIAYYGGYGRFDVPFINTRLIVNGREPLPPITVIDPHKTARSRLKLNRNGLSQVTQLFNTDVKKGFVPWEHWLKAQYGDRKSMSILLDYNVDDVLSLEQAYLKMRPLMVDHPHVARHTAGNDPRSQCTVCGSYSSTSRGSRRIKLFEVFRRSCNACGTFFESHRVKLK